jgi:hypothetical protein
MDEITTPLAVGQLQLFDYYEPALKAGNYLLEVTHTLGIPDDGPSPPVAQQVFTAQQEFVVTAPQFTLDAAQIINQYPPAGSTGRYGEVLPHIVLKDPMLAWERKMSVDHTPWLALLVFEEAELMPTADPKTRTTADTISHFRALPATVLVPRPDLEDDIDPNSLCRYIRLTTDVFQAVVPRLDELPYLSHVRKVNTDDRAPLGLHEHGLFSVTMANRFASAAGATATQPTKNIAHLVSLEGLTTDVFQYLAADADLHSFTDGVALISLASWSFFALADHQHDFIGLATNLIKQEATASGIDPTQLWLRLPAPAQQVPDAVGQRIARGYAPLAYHTRSGENTFAWYRGPLAPLLSAAAPPPAPFYTADAALLYDGVQGVFDVSLAAAWEAGRGAALADAAFGPRLLDLRKKAHQLTDALHYRLQSEHFSATQIDQLDATTTVQDTFLALLTPQLVADIGNPAGGPASRPAAPAAPSATDPVADAKSFLAEPAVQAQLHQLLADDLAPLAEWLGALLLLYPVPFDTLVPDARMLPAESLRFFYLDDNWLGAAFDGALSLGVDSTRQTAFNEAFFNRTSDGLVYEAARRATAVLRDKQQGRATDASPVPPSVVSGFLLRSALVSGWPNLVVRVRPQPATSTQPEGPSPLKLLRIDHLAPDVLLCLFDGVPDNVELSEPPESLGFGVDSEGHVVLRTVADANPNLIGQQVDTLAIRDLTGQATLCMRSPTSRVLNIAHGDGLVQQLSKALSAKSAALPPNSLSPSAFALQLFKSAEAVVFYSPPA